MACSSLSSLIRSHLKPLRHTGMTSMDNTSADGALFSDPILIQPLASWATQKTFPSVVRKPSARDVDLALNGLMSRCVVPKPGCTTKEADTHSLDVTCAVTPCDS